MADKEEDFDKWLAEQAEAAHQAIESVHGQARAKLYADAEEAGKKQAEAAAKAKADAAAVRG